MAENHRYNVGLIAGGRFAAASIKAPYFFFVGSSKEEVESKAKRALEFYLEQEGALSHLGTEAKPLIPTVKSRFRVLTGVAA